MTVAATVAVVDGIVAAWLLWFVPRQKKNKEAVLVVSSIPLDALPRARRGRRDPDLRSTVGHTFDHRQVLAWQ